MKVVEDGDRLAGPGAIVIGGDYRGLGVVRSLGRRGIPVCVATDDHVMAAMSRYCRRRLRWPIEEDAQLDFLLELGVSGACQGWCLFPTGDETAAFIARNHSSLAEHFVLTTPPWRILRWAYDKTLTYELAASEGISCPATFVPEGRAELSARACSFPAVLKPSRKHRVNSFTREKAWMVTGMDEMLARYDEACDLLQPEFIMVQELIPASPNSELSYAALVSEGEPLASLVARRARQYPIDFGRSSSFVVSIEDPEVESLSTRLLRAMRLSGLVEVEFKRDARDGRLKLLDVNPRVWGWHTLGARAGVDFPYLAWRLARGLDVPRIRGAAGIGWVRMTTDVLAVWQLMRRRRLSLRAYLRSMRPAPAFAIWAPDDPLPSLLEIPTLILARRSIRLSMESVAEESVEPADPADEME